MVDQLFICLLSTGPSSPVICLFMSFLSSPTEHFAFFPFISKSSLNIKELSCGLSYVLQNFSFVCHLATSLNQFYFFPYRSF